MAQAPPTWRANTRAVDRSVSTTEPDSVSFTVRENMLAEMGHWRHILSETCDETCAWYWRGALLALLPRER